MNTRRINQADGSLRVARRVEVTRRQRHEKLELVVPVDVLRFALKFSP
jgi:hypothetical protein